MSGLLTIDDTVRERQAIASNPALSAWVGANAGSGKTYVLSRRVIRLLLEGADPSKILCLTFTKAAAAEMSERVFKALAQWTTATNAALSQEIADLTSRAPSSDELAEARRLFAKALETPGGLKIQTIHAFCERLLHQFPMEANVAGHFEVLDDAGKEQLLREAERDILLEAANKPNGEIAAALNQAIQYASDSGYQKALRSFLIQKQPLIGWIEDKGGIAGAIKNLAEHFEVGANQTITSIQEEILVSPDFTVDYLESLRQELSKKKTFKEQLRRLEIILSQDEKAHRYDAHLSFFLRQDREARTHKSFIVKTFFETFPDLEGHLEREQERLSDLLDKQKAIATMDATRALLTLGLAISKTYETRKTASGMVDFDDLINKSANLLEKPDAAAWVHFKLDQGLDHILVDEAQDTSPRQWDVIRHLADEFFAGRGARETNRTLFAVGDEKQSIYSFQGASPEKFGEMRSHFEKSAKEAEKRFEKVALSLSFRSTADVLNAVDIVCRQEEIKAHLTDDYIDHTAARQNQPGFVELWAPFAKPPKASHDGPWWRPLDQLGEQSGQVRLAKKVATTIQTMLDKSERLEGTGEIITAGDILILTRKRGAQVDAINRALKSNGVPVSGSDRLKLLDNIAILDLLALADFMLLSEDDLALAGLLKSPLIGLAEDDLFHLANGRKNTLWNELYIRSQKGDPRFVRAYERLDQWRREADFVPPFDFFMRVLSRDHGREAFLHSLGRETDELLEAFLTEVQAYEQVEVPTLQGFVAWFRSGATEIKRDLEAPRNEVRVMTVHGAKGLEAPIVFLIDGGVPFHSNHAPDILSLGENGTAPFIWKQVSENETKAQHDAIALEKSASMAEYYRLLYVAMTRARDRLYIASTATEKGEAPKGGWFEMAHQALSEHEHTNPHSDETGEVVSWRWQSSQSDNVADQAREKIIEASVDKPSWLSQGAHPFIAPPTSLAPSRAGGHDEIESVEPNTNDPLRDVEPLQRGLLMHRLLERLPALPSSQRQAVAMRYLGIHLSNHDAALHGAITNEVLNVLDAPQTAHIFTAETAESEVPVLGTVTIDGMQHKVRGEIDRLLHTDDGVHIIDFKTNRAVAEDASKAPQAYIRQLALYRAVLTPLFPNIKTSLLWTKSAVLMTIEEDELVRALEPLS